MANDARDAEQATRFGPLRYDRRIGRRVRVDPASLEWVPLLPRKYFRRARRSERGEVVELSITGARVRAPAHDGVVVGTRVRIAVGGHDGLVAVRRIYLSNDSTCVTYGVEFLRLDPGLRELVDRTLSTRRPDDLIWRWDHST
jgi:hypothetical protein